MLRPTSAAATAVIVWCDDPAVDQEASDVSAYLENVVKNPGCWRDHLKFKPGEQPTKFVIGVIPPQLLTQYEDQCSMGGKMQRQSLSLLCFSRGLYDLQDFPPEWLDDEKEIPKVNPGSGFQRHVSPRFIDRHFVRGLRQAAIFIGGIIWAWNLLDDDDAKN